MGQNLKLANLNLTNFATFQDQTIHFGDHFNAIIGETGSGKSLILDALQLILGQRADKKIIRKGCDFACVEAIFTSEDPAIKDYFFEIGHPFEDEIVIKRIIHKSENSKAYLNFQQCPVSMLAKAGKRFIDLVGQFENQKLFSEKYQLSLLDNFADNSHLLAAYGNEYQKYLSQKEQLKTLQDKELETSQRLDYINFQLRELQSLSPDLKEEKELKEKKDKYLDLENNKKLLEEINFYFEGTEEFLGLQNIMGKLERALVKSKSLDSEILEKFRAAWEGLKEINFLLNKDLDYEISEPELNQLIEKLDLYKKLQRKFNTDTPGLTEKLSGFLKEKETLTNIDSNLRELEKGLGRTRESLIVLAKKLHAKRLESAARLSELLTQAVRELRMEGASFNMLLEEGELTASGFSKMRLNAEINPGEGFFKVK
ncbi:MAG: AAA family ATPase, partial [Bacteriovoracaceae bacterium]